MRGSLPAPTERHPALPRILPFALLLAGIAFDGVLAGRGLLPWDTRWDYGVRSVCALIAVWILLPRLTELRRAQPSAPAGDWGLAGAVGVTVLLVWILPPLRAFSQSAGGLDLHWLGSGSGAVPATGGSGFTPLDGAGRLLWGLAAMRLAGSSLVVPVAEELFWRSFVMRWLDGTDFLARDPRRVGTRALLLQALLFGLEHELWLAGMLAGLAYGWLYRRCGRLWPVILAHAVTNGLLGAWVLATGAWSYW